jgi:histidinol-phosphate aminotransferase
MTELDRRQALALALGLAALPLRARDADAPLQYPIRLSFNENPWGPGPKARAAIVDSLVDGSRYGAEYATRLTAAIAAHEAVATERIILGSGSGELLHMLALLMHKQGRAISCAWPTFGQLMGFGEQLGVPVRRVPLDAQMRHDLDALAASVTPDTGLVYVCNPNNPTGTVVSGAALLEFCRQMASKALVVVDEAYIDLIEPGATTSMIELARNHSNVLVLRTFSKIHGLAGLRVGYGIGHPDTIKALRPLQMVSPNVPGLAAATASLGDTEFLRVTGERLRADRRRLCAACDALGIDYAPPQGNFVFMKPGMTLEAFRGALKPLGFEVGRPFAPLTDYCRVTVGTTAETTAFIQALRQVKGARS